jgi:hypothetical protein
MATAFSWTPPRGAGLVVPKPNEMEQGRNDWGRRSVLEQFCSLWNIFGTKPAIPKAFFSGFQGVRTIESSTILERAMGIEPIAARG